jgi:hypothetical protein
MALPAARAAAPAPWRKGTGRRGGEDDAPTACHGQSLQRSAKGPGEAFGPRQDAARATAQQLNGRPHG